MVIHLILRLTIWFLLTADWSWVNIVLGVAIAFLLPFRYPSREKLSDWLKVLGKIIIAIPQAYGEAIEMILRPHNEETVKRERVKPGRSSALIFLDIFLITFTPKTIVLHYHERGWFDVHYVQREKEKNRINEQHSPN